jgi:hypothetical protein
MPECADAPFSQSRNHPIVFAVVPRVEGFHEHQLSLLKYPNELSADDVHYRYKSQMGSFAGFEML